MGTQLMIDKIVKLNCECLSLLSEHFQIWQHLLNTHVLAIPTKPT